MCHVSHITCQVSHVTVTVVKLNGRGSVINGATPSSLMLLSHAKTYTLWFFVNCLDHPLDEDPDLLTKQKDSVLDIGWKFGVQKEFF